VWKRESPEDEGSLQGAFLLKKLEARGGPGGREVPPFFLLSLSSSQP